MDRDLSTLIALLALRLELLSLQQLLEAASARRPGDVDSVATLVAGLNADEQKALQALAESVINRHGGKVREAIERIPADIKARRALGLVEGAPFRPAARYLLGVELGRGGLGRVVEAFDSMLNREVAVKLVLDDLSPSLLKRFVREAEITARLEHPNIVPVHDFGEQVGGGRLGLCLKRVRGRDLKELIEALAVRHESAEKYSQARLLGIFQDICHAIAFAHDHGVIHRDLKPSNVMIGDYGETLVVDWGLAKEIGAEEDSRTFSTTPAERKSGGGDLTMDGELLGTPNYMPPEQAEGRFRDVDRQSDIYSLGAILYEIIALRPPVRESDSADVWTEAAAGRLIPPSRGAIERGEGRGPRPARPVPPELEAICLRAMAPAKADRHATAMELHDDVQKFLEGVKQREHQGALAEACVRKALEAGERHRIAAGGARDAAAEATRRLLTIAAHEDKSAAWEESDRAREKEREAAHARAETDQFVSEALAHQAEFPAARAIRAQMAFDRFLEAERAGLEAECVLQRAVAEQFDDGSLSARLGGTGTLALQIRAFACRCLSEGRLVEPAELVQHGYHRFSGRLAGGPPESAGLIELEPVSPVRLRVHSAGCDAAPVEGARVWAWRFEERKRLLIPVTPPSHPAARPDAPAAPVDRVFPPDSPFRPLGPGVFLGRSPLPRFPMPMGSWLLVVEADGFAATRIPVVVGRCEDVIQAATLYRDGELGAGVVPVGAGKFRFQGDGGDLTSSSAQEPILPDFAITRHPVTCAEYAEWLNDLAKRDPAAAIAAAPREVRGSPPSWPGPPFAVPTSGWLASAPASLRQKSRRVGSDCAADWMEDWPVLGISWRDAIRFAAWKRGRDGVAWTLPTEHEWEKSARGVDGRTHVCGPHIDDAWACLNRSFPGGPRPAPISAFPHDESPYGVRGMAGNCVDLVLSTPGPDYPQWRVMRGGAWFRVPGTARTTSRMGDVPDAAGRHLGFRLARILRLGEAP